MSTPTASALGPEQTLAELAIRFAGASRVFQRHGLDFCCHGRVTVREACEKRGLDLPSLLEELRLEVRPTAERERWDLRPIDELIDHLLIHFHARHRDELPRLRDMAERVERVHGDKAECPRGLARLIEFIAGELESHMQKEEAVLFPMLRQGHGAHASGPIQVMEAEHEEHGENLLRLRELATDFVPPPVACGTWRALYLGLAELERDLMQHIHLENHVLFPRVLAR